MTGPGRSKAAGTDAGAISGDDPHARLRAAQHFLEMLPHARALGMRIDAVGPGSAVISLPWADHLVGDPESGVLHGGVVSALMDTCAGTAVLTHPSRPRATATLDLRIDYMRPAHPHQRVTARADCHHLTRSVAFVRVTAEDETPGVVVATGTGTFTIERGDG